MIARERFQLDETQRPPPEDRTQPLKDPLRNVIKKLGIQTDVALQDLLDHWPEVVGPQVAAHSRPGRLENKELMVYVTHPIWLQELQRFHFKTMQSNIQSRAGKSVIRSIRIQIDPDTGR